MRIHLVVLLAIGSVASGAGVVACFDLFHSTGDVLTACQLDAQTPGCGPEAGVDAGVDAGTDFCAWSEGEAMQNAKRACAWLGACESPLGRNAFGSCMFEALLAYDCTANPSHPVKGKTHALWDCLWKAGQTGTCDAVNACVFPQGTQSCLGSGFVTCATQGGEGGINADVRVECTTDGGVAHGENCALWGQTCGGDPSRGVCGGSSGDNAIQCSMKGCTNTMLHACNDAGLDIGVDCANSGAQQCVGEPPGDPQAAWVACLPEGDGATCTPTTTVQCDGGIATSCPTGHPESINCQQLLGNVRACTPGTFAQPFDWTAPCVVSTDEEDGGDGGDETDDAGGDAGADGSACTADSCDGGTLTACYRGAVFPLECTTVGLGTCQIVHTDLSAVPNAACALP
jgi:hypothetical protein